MQDRPSRRRNLVSTNRTLPASELHQLIGAPAPASRAHETIRPPAGGQILLASFFVGKPRLEFAQGFGKRWTRHSPTLPLVVC